MKGIRYVSEAGDTGYARAARGYLRGLRRAGIPLTWTPMVVGKSWGYWLEPYWGHDSADPEFGDLCNRSIEYDTVIVHTIPEYFPKWRSIETAPKIVGMTVWETPKLPEGWAEYFRPVDALMVPSQWNKQIFQENGISLPIEVAPHLPDPPRRTAPLRIPGVDENDFVFYSAGAWSERKGMHLTLESYLRAFTYDDPVVLVLKTGPYNERYRRKGRWWWHVMRRIQTIHRDLRHIRGRHDRPARVVVLTDSLSSTQMERLHARGDCYVALTRGEGWGLGAYEAACAGKPVITTGYGGSMEFLPEDLGYHVDYRIIPAPAAGPDQVWADPDLDHGSQLMREAFEKQQEARCRGERLGEYVRARFAEEVIIPDMLRFLRSVRTI